MSLDLALGACRRLADTSAALEYAATATGGRPAIARAAITRSGSRTRGLARPRLAGWALLGRSVGRARRALAARVGRLTGLLNRRDDCGQWVARIGYIAERESSTLTL
jgi:hypothetical protein